MEVERFSGDFVKTDGTHSEVYERPSASILSDESCSSSQNESGTHCDHWYDDQGCHWCGTKEPNLVVIEDD